MSLVYNGLFPAEWVAFWGYWLVIASRGKQARKTEPLRARILHVALVAFAFSLLAFPFFRAGFLGWQFLPQNNVTFWTGVALLNAGLAFALWARAHLGEYWSGTITLKEGHRLIRTGPYALVRHPIYAAMFVAVSGTVIAMGQVRAAIAFAILAVVHLVKIRAEEGWLAREFGQEYLDYCKGTGGLIPFPRRKSKSAVEKTPSAASPAVRFP